jgi:hypothetical protein
MIKRVYGDVSPGTGFCCVLPSLRLSYRYVTRRAGREMSARGKKKLKLRKRLAR